jgi:hypothetical protein
MGTKEVVYGVNFLKCQITPFCTLFTTLISSWGHLPTADLGQRDMNISHKFGLFDPYWSSKFVIKTPGNPSLKPPDAIISHISQWEGLCPQFGCFAWMVMDHSHLQMSWWYHSHKSGPDSGGIWVDSLVSRQRPWLLIKKHKATTKVECSESSLSLQLRSFIILLTSLYLNIINIIHSDPRSNNNINSIK